MQLSIRYISFRFPFSFYLQSYARLKSVKSVLSVREIQKEFTPNLLTIYFLLPELREAQIRESVKSVRECQKCQLSNGWKFCMLCIAYKLVSLHYRKQLCLQQRGLQYSCENIQVSPRPLTGALFESMCLIILFCEKSYRHHR